MQPSVGSLDPQAVALAKAIRQTESQNNPEARGKTGEYGAYQFMPDTWNAYAKEAGVNAPVQNATIEQQNQVAYHKIKQWKDAGYNPGQIASMWNAGEHKPNAYLEGNEGTNSAGVHYDTKAYATKVAKYYQQYKQENGYSAPSQSGVPAPQQSGSNEYAPPPPPPAPDTSQSLAATPEQGKGFLSKVGGDITNRFGQAGSALSQTASGQINPLSGLLQTIGAGAGALTDVAGDTIGAITPDFIKKPLEGAAQKVVGAAANTNLGKAAISGVQDFSQAHPELAGDIGAGLNIAGALPVLSGLGTAKDLAGGLVGKALGGSKNAVYDAVSPVMNKAELARSAERLGTKQSGLLQRKSINEDPFTKGIEQAVRENVPGFNPSNLADGINKTKVAEKAMRASIKADLQKEAAGMSYSPNELKSVLSGVQVPTSLRGTPFEKQAVLLKNTILNLAEKDGYKVPNLLDVRQDFDKMVSRDYPNLYDKESAPIRTFITGYRDALTDFTEKRAPGTALKSRLRTQSNLIRAIENMSERFVSGPTKELGSTNLSRFAGRHPVISGLVKRVSHGVSQGVGIGEGESLIR